MSRTAYATVTQASPLRIVMDGDPAHPLPASYLSTYTPTLNDRVRVEIRRSGLAPIVQGKIKP